ncbi:heavy-metal-associated domain-containing protein [Clostridium kluyveri]|uniref:Heavy metal transport/detoxification protein n=1 Tax=Clostridium kluyveri TaxID=1534 RepID=A0A1L5F7D6_CLOKL|nr:cation transporter [Clostridium kluyveri]APM38893.1 heavy metal transport/detoxification protein [Clostridium kluyveri]UZQ51212.1 cation transporter [Clostridium kluyveri]
MKKKISIKGMTCRHCAMHVEEALNEICGVKSAKADLKEKDAVVELAHNVDDEKFKTAIADAGYEVVTIETV